MQIYGPAHLHGPQGVNAPHAKSCSPANYWRAAIEQSPATRWRFLPRRAAASRLSEIPDIRHDRVATIKAQIQAGTYETRDKLNAALDALLDEIG